MSDKNISNMGVPELRKEVQSLRDELAITIRRYEDILHNLDYDNFSGQLIKEKDNMKTAIEITAKGITTKVSKEDLENEIKNSSTITQMADSIKSKVSETDLSTELEKYSTIEQTAERIRLMVSKNLDLDDAEVIEDISEAEDTDTVYVIQSKDGNGDIISEIYYYYDDILEKWTAFSGDTIYTVFNQTESGFELKGNVSINGNLITDGSISASAINTEELSCTRLYAKEYPSGYSVRLKGNMGDFGIFNPLADENASANDTMCMFGVYNSAPNVNLYIYGDNFAGYDVTNKVFWAKGDWDFSVCNITNWGDNAPSGTGGTVVAVFG